MKERPLLMSGPLVLATLADRKTQTRRLPRPGGYGQPGDLLWVRETWAMGWYQDDYAPHEADPEHTPIWYRADGVVSGELKGLGKWRPSIHMPRWASRLTLEIVRVRTEPLQAITEEDAQAEGLPRNWDDSPGWVGEHHGWLTPAGVRHIERNTGKDCDESGYVRGGLSHVFEARECFRLWWDHLNGPRAPWDSNPEVTVITFKRVLP